MFKLTLLAGLLAIASAKPGYQAPVLPIATTGYAPPAPIATSYANYAASPILSTASYAPAAAALPLARPALAYTTAPAYGSYGGYGGYGGYGYAAPALGYGLNRGYGVGLAGAGYGIGLARGAYGYAGEIW